MRSESADRELAMLSVLAYPRESRSGWFGPRNYQASLARSSRKALMARITIEDCTEKVPNRFHLVQMASIRAKQLKQGASTLVSAEENKAVVIALREIAAGRVMPDYETAGDDDSAEDASSES